MSNQRCPKCGGYSWDDKDRCFNCGYCIENSHPPAWWGSKNFHGSGYKNQRHIIKDSNLERIVHSYSIEIKYPVKDVPELIECPICKNKSLFCNKYTNLYECLNLKCKKIFELSSRGDLYLYIKY